tara:strand:- start:3451 stop:4092 length:642 start_codon:yes stop_codon:yes gene_type:complete
MMDIIHIEKPWECYAFENFLSPERWETIRELGQNHLKKFYEVGATTKNYEKKELEVRNKYSYYESEDIIPETNELFYKYDLPHRGYEGKLKKIIHWAIAPSKWTYPPHCDNKARISTTILYVDPLKSDGTILHKNLSKNDEGDHEEASDPSEYTYELEWKPNKAFFHNSIPNLTWHSIRNSYDEPRITLNSFFVQEDLVLKNRIYSGCEIDIE